MAPSIKICLVVGRGLCSQWPLPSLNDGGELVNDGMKGSADE